MVTATMIANAAPVPARPAVRGVDETGGAAQQPSFEEHLAATVDASPAASSAPKQVQRYASDDKQAGVSTDADQGPSDAQMAGPQVSGSQTNPPAAAKVAAGGNIKQPTQTAGPRKSDKGTNTEDDAVKKPVNQAASESAQGVGGTLSEPVIASLPVATAAGMHEAGARQAVGLAVQQGSKAQTVVAVRAGKSPIKAQMQSAVATNSTESGANFAAGHVKAESNAVKTEADHPSSGVVEQRPNAGAMLFANSVTAVAKSSASSAGAEAGGTHLPTAQAAPDLSREVRTLAATPTALEVGIPNGTYGWLRVRAELNQAGVVAAAVMASTSASAESLSRHLPALAEYLTQESTRIGSIVVHASSAAAGAGCADAGKDAAGLGASGGGPAGQDRSRREQGFGGGAARGSDRRSEEISGAGFASVRGAWPEVAPSAWQGGAALHWVSVRV